MTNTAQEFKVGDSFIVTKESFRNQGYTHVYVVTELHGTTGVHFTDHNGLESLVYTNEIEKYTAPQKHPHADLIIQWANDQSLEFQFRENSVMEWIDLTNSPGWYHNYQYRIKPKIEFVVKYQYALQGPQHKSTHLTDHLSFTEWEDMVQSIGIKNAVKLGWTRKVFEVEI